MNRAHLNTGPRSLLADYKGDICLADWESSQYTTGMAKAFSNVRLRRTQSYARPSA